MNPRTFAQAVNYFKGKESKRVLVIPMRSEPLQALLGVWSSKCVQMLAEGEFFDSDQDDALWDDLWAGVEIDYDRLMARTQLENIRQVCRQAIELRLIYPDGSIHSGMEAVLSAYSQMALAGMAKSARGGRSRGE